jgi:hypothetical protein
MRLTVEERVLRSTFTLNTLYKQDLEAPPSKRRIHSFIHLVVSYDRSKASSKASSQHSAI